MQDETVRAVLRVCAQDPRYPPDAYHLLQAGLECAMEKLRENGEEYRHITGAELAEGFRAAALKAFGPLALTLLHRWNIRRTRDIGGMVYNLIEANIYSKTETDRLEDFDDVYDFETAFRKPFLPEAPKRQKKERPKGRSKPSTTR